MEWVENLHAVEDGLRAVPSQRVTTLRYEDVVGALMSLPVSDCRSLRFPAPSGTYRARQVCPCDGG